MQVTNKILEEALRCAEREWPVLPLFGIRDGICACHKKDTCPSPGKHPRVTKWGEAATLSLTVIQDWWARWPDSNLGILTGRDSGLVVLDIDPRNGGIISLEELEDNYGKIPETVECITGGQGRHVYFKHPGGRIKSRSSIEPGVDIKADGGYVVAPPSLHISGRTYQWELSSCPDENDLAVIPDWLQELICDNHTKSDPDDSEPFQILEGERNTRLTSLAGSLRRQGLDEGAIYRFLCDINKKRCHPPLLEDEIRRISRSISRYNPTISVKTDLLKINCTDAGNAEVIEALFRDHLRYNSDRGEWLDWSDHTWTYDRNGAADRKALEAARYRYKIAAQVENLKQKDQMARWAITSESDYRIKAALSRAKTLEVFSKRSSDFNQNPWLLGCNNGVVDLETGELRPGRQEDAISLSTGVDYDPEVRAPRWEQFLKEIFNEDWVLIDFVQKLVGYTLVGTVEEQFFVMLHGSGSNGKSVFLSTLQKVLGEYATTTPFSTFEHSKYNGNKIPNDLAALTGKRLVTVSEVRERSHWNEGILKTVTGGDPLKVRFLHREFFTYKPQFTLWVAVNHKPSTSDTSDAFWRRVRLIPFQMRFSEEQRGNHLLKKLAKEASGILAWAVAGTQKWMEKGLDQLPDKVKDATQEYRTEEDVVQLFLDECTVVHPEARACSGELYDTYKSWCLENGERPLSGKRFGKRIKERGFEKGLFGPNRLTHFFGLGIKTREE